MRTLHLFAGAGGGILADLILGHKPVAAVELDPYACAVLRERFPGLPVIEGDVRGVDFRELAHVDAICAGFPCQDISVAGRGAGLDGERSSLFFEVMRAVDAIRPRYVFLENSPNIRTKGRTRVTSELVARGYRWRDGILAAADVGAPHIRKRWWLLAKLADPNVHACGSRWPDHTNEGPGRRDAGGGAECANVADSSSARRNEGECESSGPVRDETWGQESQRLGRDVADAYGARLEERQGEPGDDGAERATSVGDGWWKSEPGMDRVVNGLADRTHRLRCLGNGQVPLAAALAWRILSAGA